jgi:cation diffusion facilitator family transporter
MHTESLDRWQHDHIFGQDQQRVGEKRTLIVIAVTATMMVVEITTGILFGSMALLADGLHMGSHAVALLIALIAYIYARRHAGDERFSFGTGKVNALAGFTGAVLLAVFALVMAWESFDRLLDPVPIAFNSAILVAVVGLLVNGGCALILDAGHSHGNDHHHDHNLRSAYLHVIADALTSVLAIAALLTGKYLGWNWMDPVMGMVGAALVARWSVGLLRPPGARRAAGRDHFRTGERGRRPRGRPPRLVHRTGDLGGRAGRGHARPAGGGALQGTVARRAPPRPRVGGGPPLPGPGLTRTQAFVSTSSFFLYGMVFLHSG